MDRGGGQMFKMAGAPSRPARCMHSAWDRDGALRRPRPRDSGRNEGGVSFIQHSSVPSPDAPLGDGDGAARHSDHPRNMRVRCSPWRSAGLQPALGTRRSGVVVTGLDVEKFKPVTDRRSIRRGTKKRRANDPLARRCRSNLIYWGGVLVWAWAWAFCTSSGLMTSILAPFFNSSAEGTLMMSLVSGGFWVGGAGAGFGA